MYISCFHLPLNEVAVNRLFSDPDITILKKVYAFDKKEGMATLVIESEDNGNSDSPPFFMKFFTLPAQENTLNEFLSVHGPGILFKEYATTLDGHVMIVIEYEKD